ncbi:hypothetical protein RSAG8_10411, partial [Rhizoctonia solani AG-8 WAC10335]
MRVCLFEKTVLDCVSVKIRGCMKSDRWSKTKNTRACKQYAAPYLKYAGASPSIDGPNPRQYQNTRARI